MTAPRRQPTPPVARLRAPKVNIASAAVDDAVATATAAAIRTRRVRTHLVAMVPVVTRRGQTQMVHAETRRGRTLHAAMVRVMMVREVETAASAVNMATAGTAVPTAEPHRPPAYRPASLVDSPANPAHRPASLVDPLANPAHRPASPARR